MASFAAFSHPPVLDLEILEADPVHTFIIKIGSIPLDFEFIFCNDAFRKSKDRLQDAILAPTREALLFRSWAQALADFKPERDFANKRWSATVAGSGSDYKVVKMVGIVQEEQDTHETALAEREEADIRSPILRRSKEELVDAFKRNKDTLLHSLPRTTMNTRWENIQTMMEMSDVGVFEWSLEGKLLHANEAWYKLSSHPRNLPAHVEYSFIDLVVSEDQALVLSMWNTLTQGQPVTFEMRWKPRPGTNDAAQWVLSACVPVIDDNGTILSIAGNTIDINAQKKTQEAAQAKVEALERARLSELKFVRLAQLSPAAIFIFVPGAGMKFLNDQFFQLTGNSRPPVDQSEWFGLIADEDVTRVKGDWVRILRGKGQTVFSSD